MNLRTRYKRLKQYVEFTKLAPDEVFIERTQLVHYRCKSNLPLFYGINDDLTTDECAFRVAKDKLKDEFSKLIDQYTEILPDGTISLDVWVKPKSSLVTDGVIIRMKVPEDLVRLDFDRRRE